MPSISQETHFYDGKLKDIVIEILNKYSCETNFIDSIKEIREYTISIKYDRQTELHNILNLLESDHRNNYDPTNNAHVEELLPRAWNLVKCIDNNCAIDSRDKMLIKNMADNDKLSETEKNILLLLSTEDKLSDVHTEAVLFMIDNNSLPITHRKVLFNLINNARIRFLEQIADINNGTCAQGRCTRIIQLFNL